MIRRTYPDLDTYLRENGITTTAWARQMGVDKSLASRIRRKKAGLPLWRALKWAAVARVPLESFVTTGGENNNRPTMVNR